MHPAARSPRLPKRQPRRNSSYSMSLMLNYYNCMHTLGDLLFTILQGRLQNDQNEYKLQQAEQKRSCSCWPTFNHNKRHAIDAKKSNEMLLLPSSHCLPTTQKCQCFHRKEIRRKGEHRLMGEIFINTRI